MLCLLVGIGILFWKYFHESKEENPMYPPDGLMETKEEMEAHKKWVESSKISTVSIDENTPPPVSKELLSSTSDFNFDSLVIRFKSGEKEKIIFLEPGKTSPKIVIPDGPGWRLRLIDSVEVWPEHRSKYIDTPTAFHGKAERTFRLTGRNPVRLEVYW